MDFRLLLSNSIDTKTIKYTYSSNYCFLMCLLDPRVKYYLVKKKYGFADEELQYDLMLLKDECILVINKKEDDEESFNMKKTILLDYKYF